jgi:hypothetical protein
MPPMLVPCRLPLLALGATVGSLLLTAPPAAAKRRPPFPRIVGTWRLNEEASTFFAAARLRIRRQLIHNGHFTGKITLDPDTPDSRSFKVTGTVKRNRHFVMRDVRTTFRGTLSEDGNTLEGTFGTFTLEGIVEGDFRFDRE